MPNAIGHSKNGPAYRYLATREAMRESVRESVLFGLASQQELPFPTWWMVLLTRLG